jgi:hypothetical protein
VTAPRRRTVSNAEFILAWKSQLTQRLEYDQRHANGEVQRTRLGVEHRNAQPRLGSSCKRLAGNRPSRARTPNNHSAHRRLQCRIAARASRSSKGALPDRWIPGSAATMASDATPRVASNPCPIVLS